MVIRAEILGYCMGVRRAVDTVEKAIVDYPNHQIYTLGPLIHNTTALTMLCNKGVKILDDDYPNILQNETKKSVVVIRAHGTPLDVRKNLENFNVTVIDATCPRVSLNQKRSADYARRGYYVFIVGDKTHGEVIALQGAVFPKEKCIVFQNASEAQDFLLHTNIADFKSILISQTTITQDEYDAVKIVLQTAAQDILVFDTICPATRERQNALKNLYNQVNGILVVGGKNSANTRRLYQQAVQLCKTYGKDKLIAHIETADEIPKEFYTLQNIGLTAGASTPDEVIDEVEKNLAKGVCL